MLFVSLAVLALGAVDTPVTRVVELISGLKQKIQQDGKAEQALYDKYACWCEKTTDTKKALIADCKATIEEKTKSILRLKGALGSSGADIGFLKKNIAENKASTTSATEMRQKENADYEKTKAALEQGMKNLKKAIEVLGASSAKTATVRGFKDSDKLEAGLIRESSTLKLADGIYSASMENAATNVRAALMLYHERGNRLTMQDTSAMKKFLHHPSESDPALLQSPHKGAYETQSGAIQGILADMMDSFTRDYASTLDEEKTKQKDYDALMATKSDDLKKLEKALSDKNLLGGNNGKQLATDQKEREETTDELKAAEEFLATTTDACKSKANEWAERSRLRTQELAGMNEAIDILTSDTAKGTFTVAHMGFVQLGLENKHHANIVHMVKKIKTEIKAKPVTAHIQTKAKKPVAQLQTTGKAKAKVKEFEGVQHDIVVMEDDLREEGLADLKKKAHCDNERREENNKKEILEFDMDALQKEMDSGEAKKKLLAKQTQHTLGSIQKLEAEMAEYLNTRNAQNEAFKTGLKADTDAVMLLAKTIEALSKFATNNKVAFAQFNKKAAQYKTAHKEDPEYSTSEDTAPSAEFSAAGSGGSETGGIVGIIENIKQDLEEEASKAKEEEAKALQAYHDTEKESLDSIAAMKSKIASMEVETADTTALVEDKQETYDDKKRTHESIDAYLLSIKAECDWMDENFEARKKAREDEIAGLDDAKAKLAGASTEAQLIAKSSYVGKRPSVDDELKALDVTEQSLEGNFLQRKKHAHK
jgi:hypothetical protein